MKRKKALIDLHTHTMASGHAYSTIKENIEGAIDSGIKILGLSDHGPAVQDGCHRHHFVNLTSLKKDINGIRFLRGIEANIIDYDGNLDVDETLFKCLDYAIVSIHAQCVQPMSVKENTIAVLKSMDNPYTKILGHLNYDRFDLDYEAIIKYAKDKNIVIEINNSSLVGLGLKDLTYQNAKYMVELCNKYSVRMIMGSDAHIYYEVGDFTNCYNLLDDVYISDDLIINYNIENLKFLNIEL